MGEQGSERGRARVGVRELRQHLSVYLDRVKAGEELDVTEHGHVVARLGPRPAAASPLERLLAAGDATPAVTRIRDLPAPLAPAGRPLSATLDEIRSEERW